MTESNASAAGMLSGGVSVVTGLIGAVIASFLVTSIGMNLFERSELEKKTTAEVEQVPSGEQQKILAAEFNKRAAKHCLVWYSAAGAVIGGLMGVGIAFTTRFNTGLAIAAPLLSTAVAGLAVGPISISLAEMVDSNRDGLNPSDLYIMLMHGTVWAILGAAIGLGIALAAPDRRFFLPRLIGAGAFGGILGGAFMHLPGGMLLASTDFSINIPNPDDSYGRLYYFCFPMLFVSFIVGHTAATESPAAASESSEPAAA